MIEAQIEQDLKAAMLARETDKVSTLRGVKSVFLYAKVEKGIRGQDLADEEAIRLLQKEAKKRQESAELYAQGGAQPRADQELKEKDIIESYLPAKLSEDELGKIIEAVMTSNPEANLGEIIGQVKAKTAGTAEGSEIARIVKAKLNI